MTCLVYHIRMTIIQNTKAIAWLVPGRLPSMSATAAGHEAPVSAAPGQPWHMQARPCHKPLTGWMVAGNLHVDPRAAIVAIDYSTGDVLQLSGSCQILWDQHDLPGAERTLQFATQAWNWAPGGIPVTTSGEPVKPSPYNPPVGAWQPNKDVVKVPGLSCNKRGWHNTQTPRRQAAAMHDTAHEIPVLVSLQGLHTACLVTGPRRSATRLGGHPHGCADAEHVAVRIGGASDDVGCTVLNCCAATHEAGKLQS